MVSNVEEFWKREGFIGILLLILLSLISGRNYDAKTTFLMIVIIDNIGKLSIANISITNISNFPSMNVN